MLFSYGLDVLIELSAGRNFDSTMCTMSAVMLSTAVLCSISKNEQGVFEWLFCISVTVRLSLVGSCGNSVWHTQCERTRPCKAFLNDTQDGTSAKARHLVLPSVTSDSSSLPGCPF